MTLLIQNVTICNADGIKRDIDILVDGGTVRKIGKQLRANARRTIDGSGFYAVPGFLDLHRDVYKRQEYLDMTVERVLEVLEMQQADNVLSLDGALADSENFSLGNVLGHEDASFEHIENHDFINYCMSLLNDTCLLYTSRCLSEYLQGTGDLSGEEHRHRRFRGGRCGGESGRFLYGRIPESGLWKAGSFLCRQGD